MLNPTLKDYQFYHGAVLTKILNNEKPLNLRLIENKFEDFGVYQITPEKADQPERVLFIKYSTTPHFLKREKTVRIWTFIFSQAQKRVVENRMAMSLEPSSMLAHYLPTVILVCVSGDIRKDINEACVVDLNHFDRCFNFESFEKADVIKVKHKKGKTLWVKGTGTGWFSVPRNAIAKL